MKHKDAILLIFAALVTRELWILARFIPAFDGVELSPYPFSDVKIYFETYLYFGFFYASMLMLSAAFRMILPEYRLVLESWFWLQVVEFVDYFLTYNSPWFYIGSLGVSITLVKFVTLAFLIIYSWARR